MKPTGENTPFVLPPSLLAEVEAAANEEHRPVADVLRDLVERGLKDRRWEAHAGKEHRRVRTVFKTQDLSDDELKALTEGAMDARHNHLDAELQ